MLSAVDGRLGCACGESLRPALEVWALVQSRPEPGLAILAVGKRDISYDPGTADADLACARATTARRAPYRPNWTITGLNDQHAYLRFGASDDAAGPSVGDRIGLGISHPCTTFDKWHWMPVVEDDYRVSDAVVMHF